MSNGTVPGLDLCICSYEGHLERGVVLSAVATRLGRDASHEGQVAR